MQNFTKILKNFSKMPKNKKLFYENDINFINRQKYIKKNVKTLKFLLTFNLRYDKINVFHPCQVKN